VVEGRRDPRRQRGRLLEGAAAGTSSVVAGTCSFAGGPRLTHRADRYFPRLGFRETGDSGTRFCADVYAAGPVSGTPQAAYRFGDSRTNVVTPLASKFPLVLMFAQRDAPKTGIGTVVALLLPYSFFFMLGGTARLLLGLFLGWPLGPGARLFLRPS